MYSGTLPEQGILNSHLAGDTSLECCFLSHGTVVCSLCTVSGRSGPQWAGHFGQPVIGREDGCHFFGDTAHEHAPQPSWHQMSK